jgi:hypothetical protein
MIPSGNGWQSTNNTGGSAYCPVLDTTALPKASATNIYVDTWRYTTAGTTGAVACVTAYDNSATACDTVIYNLPATTGWTSLSLPHTTWGNSSYSAWYPWVSVALASQSAILEGIAITYP